MTEITKAKAKLWSRIGARAVFGQAILECAKERDDFYVLSADLAQSSGLARFRSEFPERMINTGIAEQNMIGVAAGLAKDGTNVFATSFSPFVTMRACEQVRMNMGYMQLNIKTVGLGSGLIMAQLGNSHFGLEDGSVMRAIPGMTVVNPADGAAIIKTVEALCDFKGPVYLRLSRSFMRKISPLRSGRRFPSGKGKISRSSRREPWCITPGKPRNSWPGRALTPPCWICIRSSRWIRRR